MVYVYTVFILSYALIFTFLPLKTYASNVANVVEGQFLFFLSEQ